MFVKNINFLLFVYENNYKKCNIQNKNYFKNNLQPKFFELLEQTQSMKKHKVKWN